MTNKTLPGTYEVLMKSAITVRSTSFSKQLVFTAVFAALCCVSTILIVIPLPNGYFNTGDVFVLLAGWCLGPLYGSAAAGLGSALADIIGGYAVYAPATFLIKAADGLVVYFLCALLKKCIRKEGLDFLPRLLSALVGEGLMVGGYFLYECILYGYGGAAVSVLGNTLQGGCCLLCAVIVFSALYPVRAVRNFFPALYKDQKKEDKQA